MVALWRKRKIGRNKVIHCYQWNNKYNTEKTNEINEQDDNNNWCVYNIWFTIKYGKTN